MKPKLVKKNQTLKKALKEGKLKEFAKEQKAKKGDKNTFDAILSSMAGKKKSTPGTSGRDGGGS